MLNKSKNTKPYYLRKWWGKMFMGIFIIIILIIALPKNHTNNRDINYQNRKKTYRADISSRDFYTFLRQSRSTLANQMGNPDRIKNNGNSVIYQYFNRDKGNTVFSIKNDLVIMAIKSVRSYSLAKAREDTSVQILYYLSLGFTKQGSQSGMTILKNGSRSFIDWLYK